MIESEIIVGQMVKTNRSFDLIPIGSIGTIVRDCGYGIMVEWRDGGEDFMNKKNDLKYLDLV